MNISKEMTLGEVVRNYPKSVKVLAGFGMGCVGCPSAQAETIEEACKVHGINVEEIVKALNESAI
jgi:hybrid cluster-associated redox disulfide protein